MLIAFSQHLQQCPYEEHVKLVREVTEFAKTCVADESAENCDKSIVSIFCFRIVFLLLLCTLEHLKGKKSPFSFLGDY